ncbi:hypothetical protein [Rhizobacter sp. LjRoot28]|uniref:hypothetical protein n=1 Tax=Rhizobacter sp. LjRoot28 TaxID=3342309 RepID=UPI003ECE148B
MTKRVITHEEHMRNIAGAIETTRQIPGLALRPHREFWYFEVRNGASDDLFHRIVEYVNPPLVTKGGAILEGCELTTPAGRRFRCLSFKADIPGWRDQVTQGAAGLALTVGQLVDGALVLNDGCTFNLDDCLATFD